MRKRETIEAVDFLKGFSILTIVVFHLFQNFGLPSILEKAISFGGTGVHTFILVSGFGLYLSHLKNPLPYGEFLSRRFIKIYIPYILTVSIIAAISLFIPIYDTSLYAYIGHILLYKMFDESIMGSYGYHFWFISTIIQFYLIFPILVKIKEKVSDRHFIISGIIISGLWVTLTIMMGKGDSRTWYSFFLQYLWEFMLGMILAKAYLKNGYFWKLRTVSLLFLTIVGLALYSLFAIQFGEIGQLTNDIPALCGYTALGLLLYQLNNKLFNNFILFTNRISYPLYLIHIAVKLIIVYSLTQFGVQTNILTLFLILLISYAIAFQYNKAIQAIYQVKLPQRNPKPLDVKSI